MNYTNKHIKKAIVQYRYDQPNIDDTDRFLQRYRLFTSKEDLKNNINGVYAALDGLPNSTHIPAKNLLFQSSERCWLYFERTAFYWVLSHFYDEWIDHSKGILEYTFFIERKDLAKIALQKIAENMSGSEKQKIYPSTFFIHFLLEKWLGENPISEILNSISKDYGIYQKIVDDWDRFEEIDAGYWDSLCEYHLSRIGLQGSDDREINEFLDTGLVPMELINLFKFRKKAGLDIPKIDHELFHTPMAKFPVLPTGYDQELDVKFQLVKRTVETKRKYTYQEIIDLLKNEHGEDADLFY